MVKRILVVAVFVIVVAVAASIAALWPHVRGLATAGAGIREAEEWSYYYDHRNDPGFLEAELKRKPGNEAILEHLMSAYSDARPDAEKLRQTTLAMAKYHQGNINIFYLNASEFYRRPGYRDEVISALESQLPHHAREADVYANLARMYEQKSIPPFSAKTTEERKAEWLCYYGLDPSTPLPTRLDREGAAKAERDYRKAIELSKGDDFYYSFYSEDLAGLLADMDQPEKAIPIYQDAIRSTSPKYAADAHVELAGLYREQKRDAEAAEHYRQAIAGDNEGDDGKGHATAEAHTGLGQIALAQGDVPEAERQLLLSAQEPKPCPHTTTRGMPLDLAEALIKRGRYDAPKQYLELVLKKFTPDREEVKRLLAQAEQKQ